MISDQCHLINKKYFYQYSYFYDFLGSQGMTHIKAVTYEKARFLVCFIRGLRRFQQSYSHITMDSVCDRELNAYFWSAASLKYQTLDKLHDIPPSRIIHRLTSSSSTFLMLSAKQNNR